MSNWYCGRNALKRAVGIDGADRNSVIDALIEAASREIDGLTNRRFIPKTATRSYNWPQRDGRSVYTIYLDEDLLSVSALTKEGDDVTAIASTDYFLEPVNLGPPYSRIEIDLASRAIPHLGQLPGLSCVTSGCMGQVYKVLLAATLPHTFQLEITAKPAI